MVKITVEPVKKFILKGIVANSLVVTLFCLLLCGCSPKLTPEEKVFYREYGKIKEQLCREHHLQIMGSGVAWPDKVDRLILYVYSEDDPNVDKARALFLRIERGLIEAINRQPSLQPLMTSYPISRSHLELLLLFPRGGKGIDQVSSLHGKIYYDRFDEEQNKFVEVHSERFDHSLYADCSHGD